jgi:putative ubiquitin-RnfH superfamily antitoxin RatB of RatAB toxin-antitoxin module
MADAELRVEVVWCARPGAVDLVPLTLPAGSTVDDALRASGVLKRLDRSLAELQVGVWFRAASGDTLLRDRDRVELYRPLTVDPKEARRLRYKRQRGA